MAVWAARLRCYCADHDDNRGDKKYRKEDAGNNKSAGISFLEVTLTIFLTLNTDGGSERALHDPKYLRHVLISR